MAQGLNTSKFVKTYGKPRRTQLLGQTSLWNDDLNDDFDKCLGIEDVPQTTFISPEPNGSVSMYIPAKHKKKDENQKNYISGWSMQLHCTLDSHKKNVGIKKRYTEYNLDSDYNKQKILLKSTQKKKKNLNIVNNSKGVTPISIKKLKTKHILSQEQCSTPLQKSMLFAYGNKFTSISSKKRKKTKSKKNLAYGVNTFNSSELRLQPKNLSVNSSNILMNINDDFNNSLDHSVQISSWKYPSLNKYSQNSASKKQLLNSSNRLYKVKEKKKSCSKEKKSNWYHKVINIFDDEETVTLEKSRNQDILISDEQINSSSDFESNLTQQTKQCKPLEQHKQSLPLSDLNNVSFQSLKDFNKSSSGKENDSMSLDYSKSYKKNSITTIDNIKAGTIEDSQPSQPYVFKPKNDLYKSYNMLDKSKLIENSRLASIDYASVNSLNNEPFVNKPNNRDDKLFQLKQNETPFSCINATHMIQNKEKSLNNSYSLSQDYSIMSSADHLDLKLLNVLDRIDNNKQSAYPQNNQISLISFNENIGLQSDDDQIVSSPGSESQRLINNTGKFSNITIDPIEQCDKSIIEESLIREFDHTLSMSHDPSNHNHDIISNNSFSILQSSSSLEQDTVIYKQNCKDMSHERENAYHDSLLNDKSIELKTSSEYYSKEDILKYNDESYRHTNLSSNEYIDSEKTIIKNQTNISNSVSNDLLENNESNLSVIAPRRRYAARFQNLDIIDESTQLETILPEQNTTVFHLEPGKKWRRSISIVRSFMDRNMNQSINLTKGRKWAYTVDDILRQQYINTSIHQNLEQSNVLKNSMCNTSQNLHITPIDLENQKARNYIFEVCNQQELIFFESWLEPKCTNKWKKVGEGVYGEVFSYSNGNRCTIVKIIPIEGEVNINGEQQKKMSEVYSEVVIATELNKLWNKSNLNQTSSFCKLKRVSCVQGKYPSMLINYWQQYDNDKGSDNDNPNILPKDQIFMILEMENGGNDVENFIFNSADQSLFAFLQIVFGLAVAEEVYKFEHRDLHIGNILIKKCSNKNISFKLEGEYFNVPSRGIKITIIDFTLSRMTYNSKHVYNDLAKDTELFTSVGDYQFDIYRMMRKETNDQWESFKPATNIYWLHYVLDKMLMSVHYKKTNSILHNNGLSNLEMLKNIILSFNSAKNFAESDVILNLIGYKKQ
ncbi:protein PF14_0175 [Melanaphis sacchari]|nr:protein PF14_0175 [Melanaphis sacchari]XP_025193756.1 protein PF14_0175 [Melanaphis sacchari]